jgi:dUTP pyrophosphatase
MVIEIVSSFGLLTKGTPGSVGFDIKANCNIKIPKGHQAKVSTGLHLAMPQGTTLLLRERSGLADKGITLRAGTIDSDYRGEVKVLLQYLPCIDVTDPYRLINDYFQINLGDRIAQGIFLNYKEIEFVERFNVEELSSTVRGSGGFGSTGK